MLTARADRLRCVQDADAYFSLVRRAILQARHSIFIVGWDLLANVDLAPGHRAAHTDAPTRLNALIGHVVRRRRGLRCYVLLWKYGSLYELERDPFTRLRMTWRMPRRVKFKFDDRHPFGGCHHQKLVVIDDTLAFCGSTDLTSHRWDTSAHRLEQPERKTPIALSYGPYHEVEAMLSGPAAAALGQVARERWRRASRRRVPPVRQPEADHWPAGVAPDLTDVDVTIARTMPEFEGQPAIRDCETTLLDQIARARRLIYIETQYFTNDAIGDAIERRLQEEDGPEVILVVPRECQGWLERNTMGALRERLFGELRAADAHGRLRIVFPAASQQAGAATFVHSKVMIADDTVLRIGSANLSRRSMGMDSECDVIADAGSDAQRAGVRGALSRLLGEHLGLAVERVDAGLVRCGSVRALIDEHARADRALVAVDGWDAPIDVSDALRDAADPAAPYQDGSMPPGRHPRPSVWTAAAGLAASAWSSLRYGLRGHRRPAGDAEFG